MSALPPLSPSRRSDIDWLRVLAFGLLIVYHAGMPYVSWDWHVKDVAGSAALEAAMRFVNRWRMPLIFLVSGAAMALALGRRSAGEFVRDRIRRILLPLAVGMLVVVPPQLYLERLQRGQFAGSYLEFYPHFFEGTYPAGNFSWHHLWFLAYILVIALLLLPVLLWMRGPGAARLERISAVAARRGLYWAAVPALALVVWLLQPVSFNRNALWGDWVGIAQFGLLTLLGAVLYRSPDLLAALERRRWAALAAGILAFALLHRLYFADAAVPAPAHSLSWLAYAALSALNMTAWLFAIVGLARRFLSRPSPRLTPGLAYASEAVYPFYILHQTVTVALAYALAPLPWPAAVKFPLTAAGTFLATFLLYEGLVRRAGPLRPLFGLKPRPA